MPRCAVGPQYPCRALQALQLLGTGVLGGFRAFSTYALDIQQLATEREAATALLINGRQDFAGVVKARAIGNTRGLIKFVGDAATDRILGFHIAGPDAADLVHEAVIAMHTGARYTDIAEAIHIQARPRDLRDDIDLVVGVDHFIGAFFARHITGPPPSRHGPSRRYRSSGPA